MINPMSDDKTIMNGTLRKNCPMQRFKELYIPCTEDEARAFFSRLQNSLTTAHQEKGWSHDIHGMEMLEDGLCFRGGLFFSTLLCDDKKEPYASVTLSYEDEKRHIWLCNIVPCKMREFSYTQYNEILDNFCHDVIEPIKQQLHCNTTSGTFTGAEIMSPTSWNLLHHFSLMANRTSLHPSDNRAWHQFVISAFTNDPSLDSTTLSRILYEELGWTKEKTLNLTVRYEDEIDLLREYKGV